jgi:hypothetical protein
MRLKVLEAGEALALKSMQTKNLSPESNGDDSLDEVPVPEPGNLDKNSSDVEADGV